MWIVNNSQESLSLLAFEAHPDVKEGQPKTAQCLIFAEKNTKKKLHKKLQKKLQKK